MMFPKHKPKKLLKSDCKPVSLAKFPKEGRVSKAVKRSKYKNIRCKCELGHIHLSRGEARWCEQLELRRKSGEFKRFEVEKNYRLEINGVLICNHKPDFTIYPTDDNNNFWIEEYKGFPTDLWKMKMKIFKALFPRVDYVVIFHR